MSEPSSPAQRHVMIVKGMTCEGCVRAVTRTIQRLDARATVAVDLARETVETTTSLPGAEVIAAVAGAGYEARLA